MLVLHMEAAFFCKGRNNMGYVLTKEDPVGRIYALITPTRLIDYTLDIDTASVFQDKNEAEDLRKRATKKLRGFQTVDLKKVQMKAAEEAVPAAEADKAEDMQNCQRRNFSFSERSAVYTKTEGHCAICGKFVPYTEFTVDHIVPLAKGGSNDLSNLQCACGVCNRIKQDILPEELMEKLVEIVLFQVPKKQNKKYRKLLKKACCKHKS